jgi:putative protein-disulfide isomerase
MANRLFYAHDPMCSWCWGFRPVWEQLRAKLPAGIAVTPLLGGLAPDNDHPMPESTRVHLQDTWRHIEQRIPGTRFNFAFWTECQPRRSTYPACRAVIAAGAQDPGREDLMVQAIQQAYYLHARNPSETDTLIELAGEIGLDRERFAADLASDATEDRLQEEIGLCRRLGMTGFPALVLDIDGSCWPLPVDYTDPSPMLTLIELLLQMD